MRCVLQREPSMTYGNHPQQLPTCTINHYTIRKKGSPNTIDKTRTDDTSHLHSRHQYQPGHTTTGDNALQDFPAMKHKYSRRHRGNFGYNSVPEVC